MWRRAQLCIQYSFIIIIISPLYFLQISPHQVCNKYCHPIWCGLLQNWTYNAGWLSSVGKMLPSSWLDMTQQLDYEFFQYSGASCAFFLFMFNVFDPYVSEKYFNAYKVMSEAKKADWNSRYSVFTLQYCVILMFFVGALSWRFSSRVCFCFCRINSSVHASVVGLVCLYCMLYDEGINKDPVWYCLCFSLNNFAYQRFRLAFSGLSDYQIQDVQYITIYCIATSFY